MVGRESEFNADASAQAQSLPAMSTAARHAGMARRFRWRAERRAETRAPLTMTPLRAAQLERLFRDRFQGRSPRSREGLEALIVLPEPAAAGRRPTKQVPVPSLCSRGHKFSYSQDTCCGRFGAMVDEARKRCFTRLLSLTSERPHGLISPREARNQIKKIAIECGDIALSDTDTLAPCPRRTATSSKARSKHRTSALRSRGRTSPLL